jgi:iron complex outermembrane receptor protein
VIGLSGGLRLTGVDAELDPSAENQHRRNPMPRGGKIKEPVGTIAEIAVARSTLVAVVVGIISLATAGHCASVTSEDGSSFDFTGLSMEELMDFPIYAVSRYEQPISKAPASVSIVSAKEIRLYGYRTLADILNSLPGFYITNDRNYPYVGVRGFSPIGDYNTRILLLINGHRLNDAVYDAAIIGGSLPLDVDLIDRVEVARGPSSSVYGNNAFFGVINIITKTGEALDTLELSGEAASRETYKTRASYGHVFSNGVELLVSGSLYDSEGEDRLYFKEFDDPETNNGIAENLDGEYWHNALMLLSFRNLTLQMGYGSREKDVPTAAFGGAFNSKLFSIDDYAFVNIGYDHTFTGDDNLTTRLYYDYYAYDGEYPYDGEDSVVVNVDGADSDRFGAELQYSCTFWDRHRVTVGTEYRRNVSQDQFTYDRDPFFDYLDDRRDSDIWAIYGQDDFSVLDNLLFSAGLRYDHYDTFGGTANPRLALVYEPVEKTVIKTIHGSAFRAPNVYELYFDVPDFGQKGNPDLDPESIDTYELVWEQNLGKNQQLSVAGFYNEIDDFISQMTDPKDELDVFTNFESVEVFGMEVGYLGKWKNGVNTRASYTYQDTQNQDTGKWLVNSPRHLLKFNLIVPLIRDKLFLGTELYYSSERKTITDDRTEDAFVVNATLFSLPLNENLEVSASVYNLFDEKIEHPGGTEHEQDILVQNDRSFRAKVTYRF